MTKVLVLPPALAFVLLIWFVISPPIRPLPIAIALSAFSIGLWLQIGYERHSLLWLTGLIIHVVFSIGILIKKGAQNI